MSRRIDAVLTRRDQLTPEVALFTFVASEGAFDSLGPGAHVDVVLAEDLVRSYSLIDWCEDGSSVSIAVQREARGRGGSVTLHALTAGDRVQLGRPRNTFPLAATEEPVVLLGGGIGITPLVPMVTALVAAGREVEIHYFVRTAAAAAFDRRLREVTGGRGYRLHCDDVDGLPDFTALMSQRPASTHYYVCGPEPMLQAALAASRATTRGTVHYEMFAPAAPAGAAPAANRPFQIVLSSSGQSLEVPADASILQVLRAAGHDVDYVCGEGTCGSCILDVLEGDIDHRDSILSEEEKAAADCLCICVSRAVGDRLVLDL